MHKKIYGVIIYYKKYGLKYSREERLGTIRIRASRISCYLSNLDDIILIYKHIT